MIRSETRAAPVHAEVRRASTHYAGYSISQHVADVFDVGSGDELDPMSKLTGTLKAEENHVARHIEKASNLFDFVHVTERDSNLFYVVRNI